MNSQTFISALHLVTVLVAVGCYRGRIVSVNTEAELKMISQGLFDAVATGDKAVWEKHMNDECLVIDQMGNVITREEFLAEMEPLPEGSTGSITIGEVTMIENGKVAIITHHDDEEQQLYGQTIHAEFQTTNTFVRNDGRWQLMAMHITSLPIERNASVVNLDRFNECLGVYEATEGVTYTISRDGDKLLCLRSGRDKPFELLPSSGCTAFAKGSRQGDFVFMRDHAGNVTHMIYRNDNKQLIWRKIQ